MPPHSMSTPVRDSGYPSHTARPTEAHPTQAHTRPGITLTDWCVMKGVSTEFFVIEEGMFRAEYDLEQGRLSESIVAGTIPPIPHFHDETLRRRFVIGTTCGELPFFSETMRTATVYAEKDTVAWVMNEKSWHTLQTQHGEVATEMLRIALK